MEFKFGDHVEISDDNVDWYKALYTRYDEENKMYVVMLDDTPRCEWRFPYCRKSDW